MKVSGGSKKHRRQKAWSERAPDFHSLRTGKVAAAIPPFSESKIITTPAAVVADCVNSAYCLSKTDFANANFAREPASDAPPLVRCTVTIFTVFPRRGSQVPGKEAI